MNVNMPVVCINDSNKPAEIPVNKWVIKNEIYTVVKIINTMDNKKGFILKELPLGEDTFPYDSFNPMRFVPATELLIQEKEQVNNAIKELISDICPIEN
jgi:hypothetical protein